MVQVNSPGFETVRPLQSDDGHSSTGHIYGFMREVDIIYSQDGVDLVTNPGTCTSSNLWPIEDKSLDEKITVDGMSNISLCILFTELHINRLKVYIIINCLDKLMYLQIQ